MKINKIKLELEKRLKNKSFKKIVKNNPSNEKSDFLNAKSDFLNEKSDFLNAKNNSSNTDILIIDSKINSLNKKLNKLLIDQKQKTPKIEELNSIYNKGVFIREKRNAIECQVHFNADKIKVWSETGSDITLNLPTIVKQFKKINKKGIIIGELELLKNKEFQSKEDTLKIVNKINNIQEKDIQLTICDQVYSGDIENLKEQPYSLRKTEYQKISEDKNIKVLDDELLCNSENQLRDSINKCSNFSCSKEISFRLATEKYFVDEPNTVNFKKMETIEQKNNIPIIPKVQSKTFGKIISKESIGDNLWKYQVEL